MPGTPAAATTISARWVYRGQSGTPVWTTVTAALAVGRFRREQQGKRPAERGARPRMHDLTPGDRDLVVGQQGLDAGGRAGHGARHAEGEATHVQRVQAVDILVRVDLQQRRFVVDLRRASGAGRACVHGRIVVERVDGRPRSAWLVSAGRWMCGDVEAERLGLLLLHPDVAGWPGRHRPGSCQPGDARPSASIRQSRSACMDRASARRTTRLARPATGIPGSKPHSISAGSGVRR